MKKLFPTINFFQWCAFPVLTNWSIKVQWLSMEMKSSTDGQLYFACAEIYWVVDIMKLTGFISSCNSHWSANNANEHTKDVCYSHVFLINKLCSRFHNSRVQMFSYNYNFSTLHLIYDQRFCDAVSKVSFSFLLVCLFVSELLELYDIIDPKSNSTLKFLCWRDF